MKRIGLLFAGFAIVVASFFGTLALMDWAWGPPLPPLPYPDSVRAEHANMIKGALAKYRRAHGSYPSPFTGNALSDLKSHLVDTGYLTAIPEDPAPGPGASKQYRYVSDNGTAYGLLLPLKFARGKVPADGNCVTGIGSSGQGWWSYAPDCPF